MHFLFGCSPESFNWMGLRLDPCGTTIFWSRSRSGPEAFGPVPVPVPWHLVPVPVLVPTSVPNFFCNIRPMLSLVRLCLDSFIHWHYTSIFQINKLIFIQNNFEELKSLFVEKQLTTQEASSDNTGKRKRDNNEFACSPSKNSKKRKRKFRCNY